MKNICFDPKMDSDIFTTEQAKDYLGYTYDYMRQILCEKKIVSYDNAGKTRLFLKADLDKFKKERGDDPELKEKAASLPHKLDATVWVDIPLTKLLKHKQPEIKDFTWDSLPKLRARLKAEYGEDMGFTVKVRNPEGGNWHIRYYPECIVGKAMKMVAGKLRRKRG